MAIVNAQFGWVPVRVNEALTVQWPTGLHALMAFLQPDLLVDRLMDAEVLVTAALAAGSSVHRSPSAPPAAVLGVKIVGAKKEARAS
jgi:hypothetical protein